jgi:hypothetical protein
MPEGSVISACPNSRNGPAISTAPKASTHGQCFSATRSEPLRIANGRSSSAAISVRPATIAGGENDSTAMLMNR